MPSEGPQPDIIRAIDSLACAATLLVATDYDGTIAPIVDDPSQARPNREAVAALRNLANFPETHVAVISGRELRELSLMSRLPAEIHLVGSHGSEFDVGFADELPEDIIEARDELARNLTKVAAKFPGSHVETKPSGCAFHYRHVDPDEQPVAVAEARRVLQSSDVLVRDGKMVLDATFVHANKGDALRKLRHDLGATNIIYFGDDTTDEDAFAALFAADLGIKVGEGPSIARTRIADPEAVAQLLARLVVRRRHWLRGDAAVPIQFHSLLSDGTNVALVSPDARVTWLCQPRPDGPALFAELLGGPPGGYYSVRPASGSNALRQRYVGHSMAVETTFQHLRVIDLLEQVGDASELVRTIEGDTPAIVEFAPRPDYARMPFDLRLHEHGVELIAGSDTLLLVGSDCNWEIDRGHRPIARATVDPTNGPVTLRLRLNASADIGPELDHEDRLRQHCMDWDTWVAGLRLPTRRPDLLARSAVTLRALCHQPTGAILAAATTSLPESVGGPRNWDYRYCWLRDAALTAITLLSVGSRDETVALLDWTASVIERVGIERLRPLYAVDGSEIPPEGIIDSLSGYADSRPIRIGNAAEYQTQLDVLGHVIELVAVAARHGLHNPRWLTMVDECMGQIERRWHEPDHGIWEIRDLPRHHVYSKVRCWAATGAAIELDGHAASRIEGWRALRDTIAREVNERGWKPTRNAFGAAYDGTDLDAAALYVGLSGMIPADDERFISTVEAVEHDLRHRSTVRRYDRDDGLPGFEGGFHLCALWLVEAFAMIGRLDDAIELWEGVADLAGPTGLLSEQYDPDGHRALGNFPQAYSHLGLIQSAFAIDTYLRDPVVTTAHA